MTDAHSESAANSVSGAEKSARPRFEIRTEDLGLHDLDLGHPSSHSMRDFVAEGRHAIRRRWVRALTVGGAAGLLAAIAFWFGLPQQFVATAVLRVSADEPNVLRLNPNRDASSTFDIYKRTQRQLLRSPAVLTSALQRETIAHLPLVARQADPLAWLQQIVSVTFPDDAEIMLVSARCEDRQTAEAVANTVGRVYLDDVVYAEHQGTMTRLADLQRAYTEIETNLRKKRSDLHQLADTLGAGDTEALTLAQKNTLQEYSVLWAQLNQVEFDLKRAQRTRQFREGADSGGKNAAYPVSDAELEIGASADPAISSLERELIGLQGRLDETRGIMQAGIGYTTRYLDGYRNEMERVRKRMTDRKKTLRQELSVRKRAIAEANAQSIETMVVVLDSQQQDLAARVAALRKEAEKFGRSSIDVELMRAEIKAMDDLRDRIQRELHETSVEVTAAKSRVMLLSAATTPQDDDRGHRAGFSAAFGGLTLVGSALLVVVWDLRRRRLNTVQEVADTLHLPVLGTVPWVAGLRKEDRVHCGLKDAIDGIAARLVFSPSDEAQQIVLVTSAASGEGKTTVAVNLATSLAAMGRPTVLIDFDLRRPSLHSLFDIDLSPGVAGVLDGQVEPLAAIVSTSVRNLSLLPAGAWDHRGLGGRHDELIKRIVDALRPAFGQVVIDAGPVLPNVDTRVVARHADGVIISLLRDFSEIPKVSAACDLLRSFDVRILGAVMIGAPEEESSNHSATIESESA
jgi:polysaccharide biosynthesis transport protein